MTVTMFLPSAESYRQDTICLDIH